MMSDLRRPPLGPSFGSPSLGYTIEGITDHPGFATWRNQDLRGCSQETPTGLKSYSANSNDQEVPGKLVVGHQPSILFLSILASVGTLLTIIRQTMAALAHEPPPH